MKHVSHLPAGMEQLAIGERILLLDQQLNTLVLLVQGSLVGPLGDTSCGLPSHLERLEHLSKRRHRDVLVWLAAVPVLLQVQSMCKYACLLSQQHCMLVRLLVWYCWQVHQSCW